MSGEWYGLTFSERVQKWLEKALMQVESPITNGKETYDKLQQARDIAEQLEAAIEAEDPDPRQAFEVLKDALTLLEQLKITGSAPHVKAYITLAKHAAEAAQTAVNIDELDWYEAYKANREAGQSHEEAVRGFATHPHQEERFKLRYEIWKHQQEANRIEISRANCDVCGRERRVDFLYDCARCDREACNYCMSQSNEEGDDHAYCSECRETCTHCGLQYREDQVTACKTDGKLYCDDYIGECEKGGGVTCQAHLSPCNVCGTMLCEEHERFCGANDEIVDAECLVRCRGCGEEYCTEHFDPSIEEEELAEA